MPPSALQAEGLGVDGQVPLAVNYKGVRFDCGYRIDLVAAHKLLLEIKAVHRLMPIHDARILTYPRLSRIKVGLLLNVNSATSKDGIRRIVF